MSTASQVTQLDVRESEARAQPPAASQPASTLPHLPTPWALRWRILSIVARRELRDVLFGWSLYVAAAAALLVGVLLVHNTGAAVAASGLEIVARPFYLPLLAATSLATLYLAGWATLAIARPRDQGALRVLFFAPIDPLGLLAANLLAGIAVYLVFLLLTVPLLILLAAIANLPFASALLPGIAASPAFVAPAIAMGLLISVVAPSTRGAALIFVALLAGIIAVQVGYGALLQIPPSGRYYDALLFLRELLRGGQEALRWISPLALLSEGFDAAYREEWRELVTYVAAGIAGTIVWFAIAVLALGRRGALP